MIYYRRMDQSISHQFRAALNYLLAKEGRKAQTRLAEEQGIDRGYLNAIIKGRKSGSDAIRTKITAYFNLDYEEMLSLGRRIVDGTLDPLEAQDGGFEPSVAENVFQHVEFEMEIDALKSSRRGGKGSLKISDKILRAIEVLESDTSYSDLLSGLIENFHEAIKMKGENIALQDKLEHLESRTKKLEIQLGKQGEQILKSA